MFLKLPEGRHSIGGTINGHEDVIVVGACHHVAADASIAERGGEGRGESDRVKIRIHRQGDPRASEHGVQAGSFRHLFLDHHRNSLGFAYERYQVVGLDALIGVECGEDEYSLVQLGLQASQEGREFGDRRHA